MDLEAPLYALQSSGNQLLTLWEKKVKKTFRTPKTRNSLLSRRNGKAQPANVKKGGKNKVMWSLLPSTFHVNAVLNLSDSGNCLEGRKYTAQENNSSIIFSWTSLSFYLSGWISSLSFVSLGRVKIVSKFTSHVMQKIVRQTSPLSCKTCTVTNRSHWRKFSSVTIVWYPFP